MESISSADKNMLKKEKEVEQQTNRSNKIKNYISSRRTITDYLSKTPTSNIRYKYKRYSLPQDLNTLNIDIINIMDKIKTSFEDKKIDIKFSFNKIWYIDDNMKENLVSLRKELSKENIPLNKIKNILEHDIQRFIELLMELIENISDDNLEFEILWILNNIVYFSAKFNNINLDSIKISNQISKLYLIKSNNKNEFKFSLLEKMQRILGNLLYINSKSIYTLINNNIINNIIEFLIKPVSSFRISCLWLLNKILLALKANNEVDNYINLFTNKYAISNYNFIFARINNLSLDEMSEFYWFLCELSKYDSTVLIPIFFNGFQNYNNYGSILQNFEFILNNSMTNKLSQISFRLISNLLVVCNNDLNNEYLVTKFIEIFFEKKSVILYINDVLNSPMKKYDLSLVKDVLWLIFNLICISPIKSSIFFKKGIVNLISDRDYQVNKDIMRLLIMIFYRNLISNYFSFEANDEKVIKTCLIIITQFKNEENMLILFIDILYFYLKATKTVIYDELQNELEYIKKERNPKIDNYQNIFEKLAIIVKKASPLSKFLR